MKVSISGDTLLSLDWMGFGLRPNAADSMWSRLVQLTFFGQLIEELGLEVGQQSPGLLNRVLRSTWMRVPETPPDLDHGAVVPKNDIRLTGEFEIVSRYLKPSLGRALLTRRSDDVLTGLMCATTSGRLIVPYQ